MKSIIDVYKENLKEYPNEIIIRSKNHDDGLTYQQVEDISGRVYNYLKSKNVGAGDIVSLIVDRDVWFLPLVIAVMKIGAAYVLIENTIPKERIDFIVKDSNTKLIINDVEISEICRCDYTSEYKVPDLHDPCFIIYTSGTTGNPKGILHEYGKWNTIVKINGFKYFKDHTSNIPDLYALTTSLSFAVAMFYIYAVIYLNKNIYVVSYEILKNIKLMETFLIEKKVTVVFFTPSYAKQIKNVSKYLDTILLAGEPADNLYIKGPRLVNALSSSETLVTVSSFIIDKPYAKCPLGEICNKKYVYLKDADGNDVENGEIGEICIKDEYTRGYINLPEDNKKVFVNGLCHTGDLAYFADNGKLMFAGRKDDMIKINGNRVEPLEIENKMMEIFELKNVVVKAFFENDREYLCAYLLKKELKDKDFLDEKNDKIRNTDFIDKKLKKILPQYMIPTYYVVIDEYPRNENGKLQKNKLEPPDTSRYIKEYKSPTNEIEEKVCNAFTKVLNIAKIGIDDDFFELGGDSLKTLELLVLLDNNLITAKDIYENRTVRKLALKSRNKDIAKTDIDFEDEKARLGSLPLMDEQVAVLDVQFMDVKSTCFNIGAMIKLESKVDVDRFAKAVNKVFSHHPSFNTSIYFDDEANLVQGIKNKVNNDVEIVKISENEFLNIKDNLIKPFVFKEYVNHRKTIFVTDKNIYFFFDIFHIIADGHSIILILKEIYDCYFNENKVLERDCYYLLVKQYDDFVKSENANIVKEYYKKKYLDKYDFNIDMLGLTPDSMNFSLELGLYENKFHVKRSKLLKSKMFNIMGDNVFFIFCCIIAMLRKDNKNTIAMQWLYDGRDSRLKLNSVGLFYKIMPIIESVNSNDKIIYMYEDIKRQIEFGIAYNNYSFNHNNKNILDPCLQFICQKNIKFEKKCNDLYVDIVKLKNKNAGSDGVVGVEIIDNDDEEDIICNIDYSATIYKKETIESFFSLYNDTVDKICILEDIDNITIKDLFSEIK